MRENWERATPYLNLSAEELTSLTLHAFPHQRVIASEEAKGGLANTNLRLRMSDQEEPVLVRLLVRDSAEARKEWALNALTAAAGVPVPRFFYFGESNPITGSPYILMEWIEGVRLETVWVESSPAERLALGRAVGGAMAKIHAITFPTTGFLDADLAVTTPISMGSEGLPGYLRHCLVDGHGKDRIGPELADAVLTFAEREGGLLDTWDGPPCLTHADYGGSNLLVRRTRETWEVATVLDWEFAFSGTPFMDLGNLLRPPIGTDACVRAAVAAGYREAGGYLPPEWRRMSLLVDLTAWAEFLNRPKADEALIRDALRMLENTLQNWHNANN